RRPPRGRPDLGPALSRPDRGERTMARACISRFVALALVAFPLASSAGAETLEVLGTVRTNNRAGALVFRVPAHQSHVSELRIRSGGLAVTLVGIEIEYADGKLERIGLRESLAPGQQSRPIPADTRRAVK